MLQQDGTCVWEEDPQGADRAPPKAQEASPQRAHRGSGASASGPDPHQKGLSKFTSGRQRKEVCAKILRLSHFVKYFAQHPDCLNVTASRQAQDPKMNQRGAGHGKESQEHHSSKKTGRQVER